MQKKLSIIIVSYNRRELLKLTLASIKEHANEISHEVIVVDNASGDKSAEMVSELFPEAILIKNKKNTGCCPAYNLGFKKAHGQYICMMHEDAAVLKDTLQKLINFMDANKSAGYVGPQSLSSKGTPLEVIEKFHTPLYNLLFSYKHMLSSLIGKAFLKKEILINRPMRVDWLPISCLLIRHCALVQTGYFHKDMQLWWDDAYLQFKMRKIGWKGYFLPQAKIIHQRGLMNKIKHKTPALEINRLIWIQSKYFYYRYFFGLTGVLFVKLQDFFIFNAYLLFYCVKYIAAPSDAETKYQINLWFQYLLYIFYAGKKQKFNLSE